MWKSLLVISTLIAFCVKGNVQYYRNTRGAHKSRQAVMFVTQMAAVSLFVLISGCEVSPITPLGNFVFGGKGVFSWIAVLMSVWVCYYYVTVYTIVCAEHAIGITSKEGVESSYVGTFSYRDFAPNRKRTVICAALTLFQAAGIACVKYLMFHR